MVIHVEGIGCGEPGAFFDLSGADQGEGAYDPIFGPGGVFEFARGIDAFLKPDVVLCLVPKKVVAFEFFIGNVEEVFRLLPSNVDLPPEVLIRFGRPFPKGNGFGVELLFRMHFGQLESGEADPRSFRLAGHNGFQFPDGALGVAGRTAAHGGADFCVGGQLRIDGRGLQVHFHGVGVAALLFGFVGQKILRLRLAAQPARIKKQSSIPASNSTYPP